MIPGQHRTIGIHARVPRHNRNRVRTRAGRLLLLMPIDTQAATIVDLRPEHWPEVARIYADGIATGNATFETEVPTWEQWDPSPYRRFCAFILLRGEESREVSPPPLTDLGRSGLVGAGRDEAPRLPDRRQPGRPLSQRPSLYDDLDSGGVAEVCPIRLVEAPAVPGRQALVDRHPGQGIGANGGRDAHGERAQRPSAPLIASRRQIAARSADIFELALRVVSSRTSRRRRPSRQHRRQGRGRTTSGTGRAASAVRATPRSPAQ
jgi:hypothetical protein